MNWMSEFDERGRPCRPATGGTADLPRQSGRHEFHNPSHSPRTRLFYVSAWDDHASIFTAAPSQFKEGTNFVGGGPRNFGPVPGAPGLGRSAINTWTESAGHGAVIALDSRTGEQKWKFTMTDVTDSGILTTASDLLFTGGREGYFQALDARTGALLWKVNLGAAINSGPVSYRVGTKQFVSIVSGLSLSVFALDEP
jgi:alcohol dehydrogenase (cytochrome c)